MAFIAALCPKKGSTLPHTFACSTIGRMPHLSHSLSGAIRTFSFWMANGTVGLPLLEGVDYSCIFSEASGLEQVYAIFANVLELDEEGRVINAKYAERRAAQYILQFVSGKPANPPFEDWEICLYAPPPKVDPKRG